MESGIKNIKPHSVILLLVTSSFLLLVTMSSIHPSNLVAMASNLVAMASNLLILVAHVSFQKGLYKPKPMANPS